MTVFAGKFLRVDLTKGSWQEETIDEEQVKTWLLGSGFAAKLYYDEMDPDLDPLDPASPLLIFNGVLAGTFAPTGCRTSFCGKSPLTGIWNEANLGHYWGAELRFAGYDGLVGAKVPASTPLKISSGLAGSSGSRSGSISS